MVPHRIAADGFPERFHGTDRTCNHFRWIRYRRNRKSDPSIIGTCFGRFGFIQANRLIAPVNTAIRSTALVIIGIIGVEHLNTAYMVFFAFSVLAIILISFIKPKTYE